MPGAGRLRRRRRQTDVRLPAAGKVRDPYGRAVWHGGRQGEPEALASCYRRSLELAATSNVSSIAFPSISTGVYGYPIEPAADIAVRTVAASLAAAPSVREVVFCCFSARDLAVYQKLLDARRA
jgi:O-acetyl-ADP-ribose deacetylase (regulator of RNase III)